jgi:hypothetical protein
MKSRIFISYRRDEAGWGGRLYESLSLLLQAETLAQDVHSIELGDNFKHTIEEHIRDCNIVLLVVGHNFLNEPSGVKRSFGSDDVLRFELEKALELKKIIIPVLMNDQVMPLQTDLPVSLKAIAELQAESLRHKVWKDDIARLSKSLKDIIDRVPVNDVPVRVVERIKYVQIPHNQLLFRKWIGYLCIVFPLVMVLGDTIFQDNTTLQSSLGSYYTQMRDYYVLFHGAIAVLLLVNTGITGTERIICAMTGLCCLSLVVTRNLADAFPIANLMFFSFQSLFYIGQSMLFIFYFTRTNQSMVTSQKRMRNKVYRMAGIIILSCLLLLALTTLIGELLIKVNISLWLETLAYNATGVAWLTKGESFFKDPMSDDEKLRKQAIVV